MRESGGKKMRKCLSWVSFRSDDWLTNGRLCDVPTLRRRFQDSPGKFQYKKMLNIIENQYHSRAVTQTTLTLTPAL